VYTVLIEQTYGLDNYLLKVSNDGRIYRLNCILSGLQHFVNETLGLKGNWSSPGGALSSFLIPLILNLLSNGMVIPKSL
jgi:hypothetical protein